MDERNNQTIQVGCELAFGMFPQSKDGHWQPIIWLVQRIEEDRMLLLSKYGIDCQPFDNSTLINSDTTWQKSALRRRLNSEFYHLAFTDEERSHIIKTRVMPSKNPDYTTSPGKATEDYVYLPGPEDLRDLQSLKCQATEYAIANGAMTRGKMNLCTWWLRTPGVRPYDICRANYGGGVVQSEQNTPYRCSAVRPVIWVDKGTFDS